jgi:uncharacterized membrane protein
MINRQAAVISGFLIIAMLAAGLWAIAQLPADARVVAHWGIDGQPNGWMNKWRGLLIGPAIAAIVWIVKAIVPFVDPRRAKLAQSAYAYGVVWLAVTAVIGVAQVTVVATAVGRFVDVPYVFGLATGALFLVVGNIFGKLRWSYFVGIRTPWTLDDEQVWDRTHRLGGWVWVIAGFAMIGSTLSLSPPLRVKALVALALVAAAVPVVGSYWFWRQKHARQ